MLNLKHLEQKLDITLAKKTKESLTKWLEEKRQNNNGKLHNK